MRALVIVSALVLVLLLTSEPIRGERQLLEISWSELEASDRALSGGTLVASGEGWQALRITGSTTGQQLIPILRLSGLEISQAHFAILGHVRTKGVEGTGFLEMWSLFPDGGRYFSRGLGSAGPTQSLQGSSEWRPFVLPFYINDSPARPIGIEFNLVLPGRGTVELGPLSLVEFGPGEDALESVSGTWWSTKYAGWLGGLGGSALGVVGAIIGILMAAGRGRGLVTALVALALAGSLTALSVGGVAFFSGQPFAVYYPLVLGGAIGAIVMAVALATIPKRYAAMELRRMDAFDV